MHEEISNINGIEFCSALNTNLKSFCLSLYVRAGSIFEDKSNNGITHLLEHIVFRNLKNKYGDFYNMLSMHGIELQGCTYKEFLRFSINGPSSEFAFAVDVLCSMFDEIRINTKELNNEKKRIKAEIRENDEKNTLDYFFNRIVWKDSEAEKTVSGYCKVLDNISIKKLNDFKNKFFSKGNCIVFVTGNVCKKDIDILKKRICIIDIQDNQAVYTNTVSVNNEFFHRNKTVIVKNNYWHYIKFGFDINHTKYSNGVLDLLYAVLFKGENALVHNYLSEENHIIYSYDSTLEQYDNVANMNFMFEVEKDNIENAVKNVVFLLNDVKTGRFNFEANLKAEIHYAEMELDRPDDLNWSLTYYNHILKGKPIDYTDSYYGRFNITKKQVIEAAREIFQSRNMTVAIKGNKRKINIQNIESILRTLDKLY